MREPRMRKPNPASETRPSGVPRKDKPVYGKRAGRTGKAPAGVPPCPEPPAWSDVWVLADVRSRARIRDTHRLLGRAGELAGRRGQRLSAVLLGHRLDRPLETLLAGSAPDRVLLVDHPRLAAYRQETYTGVLAHLVQRHRPEILLLLANDLGRELAPRVAARLGTGLCADCIRLEIEQETGLLVQSVPAFGDHVVADIVTPHARPQMCTVRPGALPGGVREPAAPRDAPPQVIREPLPARLPADRVRRLGAERERSAGKALEGARTVICGGRGMGTKKRFQVLRDLAALLGGEVGATRPAVHAEWIDPDCMVGQTGREVAPEVLLLFGVSGAAQFTASIQQARTIVAVNRDPAAAIFSLADLGVVGDVKLVLPALVRKVQKALVEQMGRSPEEVFARAGVTVRNELGTLLRDLRGRRGYTVDETARALGVDPGELGRIETNQVTPSVSFLLGVARLFRVDPAPFLTQAEGARSDRRRMESFTKRTRSYSYRTLTPGAEHEHLRAFQVTIDPGRDHKMVEYRHEGEEFVYVLRGRVEIRVGEETHALRRGDTLHFQGSIAHHLRNPSREKADLIVVLYTP